MEQFYNELTSSLILEHLIENIGSLFLENIATFNFQSIDLFIEHLDVKLLKSLLKKSIVHGHDDLSYKLLKQLVHVEESFESASIVDLSIKYDRIQIFTKLLEYNNNSLSDLSQLYQIIKYDRKVFLEKVNPVHCSYIESNLRTLIITSLEHGSVSILYYFMDKYPKSKDIIISKFEDLISRVVQHLALESIFFLLKEFPDLVQMHITYVLELLSNLYTNKSSNKYIVSQMFRLIISRVTVPNVSSYKALLFNALSDDEIEMMFSSFQPKISDSKTKIRSL